MSNSLTSKEIGFPESVAFEKRCKVEHPDLVVPAPSNVFRVGYLSDLHVGFRYKNNNAFTKRAREYVMQQVVLSLLSPEKMFNGDLLIIAGDLGTEPEDLRAFLKTLRSYTDVQVVVVLGNHDIWCFKPDTRPLAETVAKYQNVCSKFARVHLLQNDLVFLHRSALGAVTLLGEYSQFIPGLPNKYAAEYDIGVFGGIGFSGQNLTFNSHPKCGHIYRDAVNRKEEMEESEKCSRLYDFYTREVTAVPLLVVTHTPLCDWYSGEYVPNVWHISGHTHKNTFYDDGSLHVYCDGQIGYEEQYAYIRYIDIPIGSK